MKKLLVRFARVLREHGTHHKDPCGEHFENRLGPLIITQAFRMMDWGTRADYWLVIQTVWGHELCGIFRQPMIEWSERYG